MKAAEQPTAIVVVDQSRQSYDLVTEVVALAADAGAAGELELAGDLHAITRYLTRTAWSRGAS